VVIESQDVECPECKKFRITKRALEFIEHNRARLNDELLLVSRAAREAEVPIFLTDADDIVETAAKRRATETAVSEGE